MRLTAAKKSGKARQTKAEVIEDAEDNKAGSDNKRQKDQWNNKLQFKILKGTGVS